MAVVCNESSFRKPFQDLLVRYARLTCINLPLSFLEINKFMLETAK